MNREFYVIGATARDIIIRQLIGTTSGRKTRDLDIAIAIPDWSVFDEIKENLIEDGFKKSQRMHQRFYYGDYELDVVPYGVAKDDDNIYWLAHDLLLLLSKEQLAYYILEHSYGLTYETVRDTWQTIADVFQKAMNDENI